MMNGLMDESMNAVSAPTKLVAKAWDLRVYKEAFQLALEIHEATLNFPKIEQYDLASQIRRASKSICANIAEGFAKQKYSKPEFSRYLSYAEASANEVQVWLQFAVKLKYISKEQYKTWATQANTIAAQTLKLRP